MKTIEINELLIKIKNDELDYINIYGTKGSEHYDRGFNEIIKACNENSITYDIGYNDEDNLLCYFYNFKITT